MDNLYVIKIGGNIIDDETKLSAFLKDFASIRERKILIHGGGKLASGKLSAGGRCFPQVFHKTLWKENDLVS